MKTKGHFFPIIHIIGLPGAGKTTLAGNLAKKWNLPVYRIGNFRSRFPSSVIGEADAWTALFSALSKKRWSNCILETTGLNRRETFLTATLPFERIVRIKLHAKKSVLYARVGKKPKSEQGNNDWIFGDSYKDKHEFIKKLYGEFKKISATIVIDTNKLTAREVYQAAVKELSFYLERL
jgi:GTPase SAR1 family protein